MAEQQPIRKTAAFAGIVLLLTAVYAGGVTQGVLSSYGVANVSLEAGNTAVGNEQVYDGDGICTGNVDCSTSGGSAFLIGSGALSLQAGRSRRRDPLTENP